MSKTFKSMHPDSVLSLQIGSNHDGSGVHVAVLGASGLQLAKPDAPALALAILEAAGITDKGFAESSDAEMAVAHLASHVGLERANAKEAADREALEGEARILFDAGTDYITEQSITNRPPQRWDEVTDIVRAAHVIVARKARELHGATK